MSKMYFTPNVLASRPDTAPARTYNLALSSMRGIGPELSQLLAFCYCSKNRSKQQLPVALFVNPLACFLTPIGLENSIVPK